MSKEEQLIRLLIDALGYEVEEYSEGVEKVGFVPAVSGVIDPETFLPVSGMKGGM